MSTAESTALATSGDENPLPGRRMVPAPPKRARDAALAITVAVLAMGVLATAMRAVIEADLLAVASLVVAGAGAFAALRRSSAIALIAPLAVAAMGVSTGAEFRDQYWAWACAVGAAIVVPTLLARVARHVTALDAAAEQLAEAASAHTLQGAIEAALQEGRGRNFVDREIARAARYEREVTIAVSQVDGIDVVRKRLGDDAARDALVRLGRLFADDTRQPDGGIGDELRLVFVFPETPLLGARVVTERMRLAFAREHIAGPDGIPLTMSVGLAAFPHDGDKAADLLAVATAALERAHAAGGNRTILSHSPEGTPPGWSGAQGDPVQ